MQQQHKTGFYNKNAYCHSAIADLCINSRFTLSYLNDLPAVQSNNQKALS